SVPHGVHILSIDETRADFTPIVWTSRSQEDQVLEQIWLPGVHGDIGGGYDDAFLSTISLLTMIDKLSQYYPDVAFDQRYIAHSLLPIVKKEDIIVNDEWNHYPVRYLAKKRPRTGTEGSHASVHPLVRMMPHKDVAVRGQSRHYAPPSWEGGALPDTE